MGILKHFKKWRNSTVTFQVNTPSLDSDGRPVDNWVNVVGGVSIKVNLWTNTSRQTDKNDQFVNSKIGTVLLDPGLFSFTPDLLYRFIKDSVEYYIIGNDNISDFNEVLVLPWEREYKTGA